MDQENIIEGELSSSPLPQKSPVITMNFPAAMQAVIDGKKVTRLEWNSEDYGFLKGEYLMIKIKGEEHQWVVRDGDILAEDWIVVQQSN